mmetsp:Transcript_15110/g.46836  ORF Transcript_15110/g.46836 Transcript_15110/m.46836 type:complete len:551 (-) Transcript_15110:60-1712(-)
MTLCLHTGHSGLRPSQGSMHLLWKRCRQGRTRSSSPAAKPSKQTVHCPASPAAPPPSPPPDPAITTAVLEFTVSGRMPRWPPMPCCSCMRDGPISCMNWKAPWTASRRGSGWRPPLRRSPPAGPPSVSTPASPRSPRAWGGRRPDGPAPRCICCAICTKLRPSSPARASTGLPRASPGGKWRLARARGRCAMRAAETAPGLSAKSLRRPFGCMPNMLSRKPSSENGGRGCRRAPGLAASSSACRRRASSSSDMRCSDSGSALRRSPLRCSSDSSGSHGCCLAAAAVGATGGGSRGSVPAAAAISSSWSLRASISSSLGPLGRLGMCGALRRRLLTPPPGPATMPAASLSGWVRLSRSARPPTGGPPESKRARRAARKASGVAARAAAPAKGPAVRPGVRQCRSGSSSRITDSRSKLATRGLGAKAPPVSVCARAGGMEEPRRSAERYSASRRFCSRKNRATSEKELQFFLTVSYVPGWKYGPTVASSCCADFRDVPKSRTCGVPGAPAWLAAPGARVIPALLKENSSPSSSTEVWYAATVPIPPNLEAAS